MDIRAPEGAWWQWKACTGWKPVSPLPCHFRIALLYGSMFNGSYVTWPDNRGIGSSLKPEHHTPPPTHGACNLQIVPAERRVVH